MAGFGLELHFNNNPKITFDDWIGFIPCGFRCFSRYIKGGAGTNNQFYDKTTYPVPLPPNAEVSISTHMIANSWKDDSVTVRKSAGIEAYQSKTQNSHVTRWKALRAATSIAKRSTYMVQYANCDLSKVNVNHAYGLEVVGSKISKMTALNSSPFTLAKKYEFDIKAGMTGKRVSIPELNTNLERESVPIVILAGAKDNKFAMYSQIVPKNNSSSFSGGGDIQFYFFPAATKHGDWHQLGGSTAGVDGKLQIIVGKPNSSPPSGWGMAIYGENNVAVVSTDRPPILGRQVGYTRRSPRGKGSYTQGNMMGNPVSLYPILKDKTVLQQVGCNATERLKAVAGGGTKSYYGYCVPFISNNEIKQAYLWETTARYAKVDSNTYWSDTYVSAVSGEPKPFMLVSGHDFFF